MSPDTWSFSMAKFLELTFHAKNYQQFNSNEETACCKHSLFQDHYQYFRYRNIVTVFSTSKINIRSLYLPEVSLKSTVINDAIFFLYKIKMQKIYLQSFSRSRNEYIDEIKELFEKGLSFYSTLLERISALKSKFNSCRIH